MVRGINSFSATSKMNGFLLKGNTRNMAKTTELPAKVAIGTLGAFGIANSIKEPMITDQFVMKCSDYDSESDTGFDYCTPLFP